MLKFPAKQPRSRRTSNTRTHAGNVYVTANEPEFFHTDGSTSPPKSPATPAASLAPVPEPRCARMRRLRRSTVILAVYGLARLQHLLFMLFLLSVAGPLTRARAGLYSVQRQRTVQHNLVALNLTACEAQFEAQMTDVASWANKSDLASVVCNAHATY